MIANRAISVVPQSVAKQWLTGGRVRHFACCAVDARPRRTLARRAHAVAPVKLRVRTARALLRITRMRRSERIQVDIPVVWTRAGRGLSCVARDLNMHGLFLCTDGFIEPGSLMHLRVALRERTIDLFAPRASSVSRAPATASAPRSSSSTTTAARSGSRIISRSCRRTGACRFPSGHASPPIADSRRPRAPMAHARFARRHQAFGVFRRSLAPIAASPAANASSNAVR